MSRKVSGGVGSRFKAEETPSSLAIVILARGLAVSPQMLLETPYPVVPNANSKLLVSGKASGGMGSHLKAGETPLPVIMSMVNRVVETFQTMPEKTSPMIEGRDVVPWSPEALYGIHSGWGFGNLVVVEVHEAS